MADAIHAASSLLSSTTGAETAPKARATHKIIFHYDNSDDDEGTTITVAAPQHQLTLDAADLEDPCVETIDGDTVAFQEDVTPAQVEPLTLHTSRSEVVELKHELSIPRAPDGIVSFYRKRAQQEEVAARRQAKAAVDAEAAAQEGDASEAEPEPDRPVVKRDRDVKVTADGYHLTLDERDLASDWSSGLTRPIRRQPTAEPDRASSVAASGLDAPDGAHNDEDDDVDDEDDEEEDEEDIEMDELLLVAAGEQLARCCEAELKDCPPEDPRDVAAFSNFVALEKSAREKLCNHEMTPMEYALLIRPSVGPINGVLRRASRPPKAEPIVINGVVMDM